MDKITSHSKKAFIGLIGGSVVVMGLILVPYPGPGWLIVFAGLAILATKFDFAKRLNAFGRRKYDLWLEWFKSQPWYVRVVSAVLTSLVVVMTLWLLNTFGLLAASFGIDLHWLTPPYFR